GHCLSTDLQSALRCLIMSDSSTDLGSAIRPGKFNGKGNFSAWKFKTLAYLQSLGLKDVVVVNPLVFQGESTESKGVVTATNALTVGIVLVRWEPMFR